MHPTTMYVRPREGLKIPNVETGDYLPEAGAHVPRSPYWLRRVNDGDVEIIHDMPNTKTTQPEAKSAMGKKE